MSVEPALKKLEEDALDLQGMATKYWIDGAPVGFIVPGQYQQAVVTAYFIQAAERFDDELESLIAKEYPNADSKQINSFGKRVDFPIKNNCFAAPTDTKQLQKDRNAYAHEPGKYADWAAFTKALSVIRTELKHMGILPTT